MSDISFEVCPYTHEKFVDVIAGTVRHGPQIFTKDIHGIYFREYFEFLKAKTMVVEDKYVDQNYLNDFSAFYVNCFQEYGRFCKRIHLFDQDFDHAKFLALLDGKFASNSRMTPELLNKCYLGFVVVKPLPSAPIGKTCLKTYSGDGRQFPVTESCKVSLFGINLSVKTIAFQQQDQVTAACATSALWSAFHCTGQTFHHWIPSPHEITASAKQNSSSMMQTFPNRGLNFTEMAQSVRAVGLEPVLIGGTNVKKELAGNIYGYLMAKIPIILGIELFNTKNESDGFHAITITGFKLEQFSGPPTAFQLHSDRITKIYAHDDQVGPFARMEFEQRGTGQSERMVLSTSFAGVGSHYAVPINILVPMDRMLRIQYPTIRDMIEQFDKLLKQLATTELSGFGFESLSWDIHLSSVNDLKNEIFKSTKKPRNILTALLPKYLWRAKAVSPDAEMFELLFDTTDVERGQLTLCVLKFAKKSCDELSAVCLAFRDEPTIFAKYKRNNIASIIEAFASEV
jgi:hypothetical protein